MCIFDYSCDSFSPIDLINDWSSRNPADVLHHIPYTWFLNFCLKEFELVTIANQYNWVDCSSQRQENGKYFAAIFSVKQNYLDFFFRSLFIYFFFLSSFLLSASSLRGIQRRLSRTRLCPSVYRFPASNNGTKIPHSSTHLYLIPSIICFEFHQYINMFIHLTGRIS